MTRAAARGSRSSRSRRPELCSAKSKVPEIRERYEALARSQVLAARAIVRRGIRRGELAESTSVTVLLDALCGGAMMHAMSTPRELRDKVTAGAEKYAGQLVDFVLGSASAAGRMGQATG